MATQAPTLKKTGSITIMGNTYTVEYHATLEDASDYGETIGHEKLIRVSLAKHGSKKQLHSTLFHEIIHATLAESGLTHILSAGPGDTEEALIVALENALLKILDFKPHVLRKLEGLDKE